MQMAGLQGAAERLVRPQDMPLTDEAVQAPWPHPVRQRPAGVVRRERIKPDFALLRHGYRYNPDKARSPAAGIHDLDVLGQLEPETVAVDAAVDLDIVEFDARGLA